MDLLARRLRAGTYQPQPVKRVWIEKLGADPLFRLMVAQDTGGAIKGAQRADIFYGSGRSAGKRTAWRLTLYAVGSPA